MHHKQPHPPTTQPLHRFLLLGLLALRLSPALALPPKGEAPRGVPACRKGDPKLPAPAPGVAWGAGVAGVCAPNSPPAGRKGTQHMQDNTRTLLHLGMPCIP